MKNNKNLKVSIVMGSQSDYKTLKLTENILKKLGIKFETKIILYINNPIDIISIDRADGIPILKICKRWFLLNLNFLKFKVR